VDNAPEITVLQLPKFKAEATELIRADGIEALEQVWPKPIDVKAIRRRVKMSQAEFSRTYGISKRALQEWEQGGRQPDSAARAYLIVIAKEPAVVRRALASK
jgi:DNA-binding transcriptional regulator YiaG